MKTSLLLIFILVAALPVSGQVDTSSKARSKKAGFSLFGGLGLGGNDMGLHNQDINSGFAKAVSARYHYGMHTLSAYYANVTARDEWQNNAPRSLLFVANNFGLSYGIGTYLKHFSAGCLIGVGYASTRTAPTGMSFSTNWRADQPVSLSERSNVVSTCLGLHASVHLKRVGIGYQVYYHFGEVSSYTALLGIEVRLH